MAYLNAKRKEMEELAAVAQMQTDLAQHVSSRMEVIESLLAPDNGSSIPNNNIQDPEVDYWRNKLAELSAPVPGTSISNTAPSNTVPINKSTYSSPTRNQHKEHSNKSPHSPHSPHITAVFAHDSSNASRHRLLQPNLEDDNVSHKGNKKLNFDELSTKHSNKLNLPLISPRSASKQLDDEHFKNMPLSYSSPISSNKQKSDHHSSSSSSFHPQGNSPTIQTKEDPEVEYWRRKIAELSTDDPSSKSSGYHTSSLPADLSPSLRKTMGQPPPTRPNLTNPRYKSYSLADEALSWEGTESFAAENETSLADKKYPPPPSHDAQNRENLHNNHHHNNKNSHHKSNHHDHIKPKEDHRSSSSTSSSWRSEMKQLFDDDDDDDYRGHK